LWGADMVFVARGAWARWSSWGANVGARHPVQIQFTQAVGPQATHGSPNQPTSPEHPPCYFIFFFFFFERHRALFQSDHTSGIDRTRAATPIRARCAGYLVGVVWKLQICSAKSQKPKSTSMKTEQCLKLMPIRLDHCHAPLHMMTKVISRRYE